MVASAYGAQEPSHPPRRTSGDQYADPDAISKEATLAERKYKADRELIAREAPSFIEAVQKSKAGETDGIILTIDAFGNEPELLREVLVYAAEEGATVIFAPDADR
jgi:hypothetical protein